MMFFELMRDRKQYFIILTCSFFAISCGDIQNKTEPCNCFTLEEYKKFNSESQKDTPSYNLHAKLKKIDRNWLIKNWLYVPPDQAFQIGKKFQCATDTYETFEKNGDIIYAEDGEKIGTWEFSQDKLKITHFYEYDEKGNETKKISTTTSHIGKIAENIFIAIKDDGSLEAYIEC